MIITMTAEFAHGLVFETEEEITSAEARAYRNAVAEAQTELTKAIDDGALPAFAKTMVDFGGAI